VPRNATPRTEIIYNIEPFRAAVREGDWKLIWRTLLPSSVDLYNIAQDPSEKNNLAAANPDKVAELQKRLDATTIRRLLRLEATINGSTCFSKFEKLMKKEKSMRRKLLLALASGALLLAFVSQTQAGPVDLNGNALPGSDDGKAVKLDNSKDKEPPPIEKSWCETPPEWEIRFGMPGWLAGISGDVGVKGVAASESIDFDQLFKHLTHVPLAISFDTRYKRWEFFGDGQFMVLGDEVSLPGLLFTNAHLSLTSGLGEAFIGYRLINCQRASLSLFAGFRYTYLGGELSIFDNGDARLAILRQLLGLSKKLELSDNTSWVDPVIGARGKIGIWKAISLYAEVDGGGFNANAGSAYSIHRQGQTIVRTPIDASDWSYQVQGGLELQLTRSIWTQIGWRYMKYDYQENGFTYDPALSGPFIQAGINF
jgi:hypothetical protein